MNTNAPAVDVDQLVQDSRRLIAYAQRHGILLPSDLVGQLDAAPTKLVELRKAGAERESFIKAVQDLADRVKISIADLDALQLRTKRLAPLLDDANALLAFASANAKAIPEEIRNTIVQATDAVEQGKHTAETETAFLNAYQELTTTLAPITAATLVKSETRLPNFWDAMVSRKFGQVERDLLNMTFGRFLHFFAFMAVLLVTGIALGYQTFGETALSRYRDLDKELHDLGNKSWVLLTTVREKELVLASETTTGNTVGEQLRVAQAAYEKAKQEHVRNDELTHILGKERDSLPNSLRNWLKIPCEWSFGNGLCLLPENIDTDARELSDGEIVFLADSVIKRMNMIVLPLLLGLLGSYAFVLRNTSLEIRQRTYSPDSALHNLVRLSLGAMAGIAAGWLLKPEQVGLLESVPAWVVAFIAGYGTELVFAFMDRIIATFSAGSR